MSTVTAAERDRIGVQEMTVGDNRQGGRTGAEIDAGNAELRFVRGDNRQRTRIRRSNKSRDTEMAPFDAQHQIAGGRLVRRDRVQVHSETLAAHAARLRDTAIVVQTEIGRKRMKHRAPVARRILAAAGEQAADVVLAHRAGR